MSWDDLSKNEMVWPSVREVNAYRRQVYELVRSHILTHPSLDDLPVSWVSRGAWVAARGQPAAATFKPGAACQPASQSASGTCRLNRRMCVCFFDVRPLPPRLSRSLIAVLPRLVLLHVL